MLVIAAIVNWKDIREITSGARTFGEVIYGKPSRKAANQNAFKFPGPLGPMEAKIKVLVVCREGEACHLPLVELWKRVAELEPKRLRVEWVNTPGGPSAASSGAKPGTPKPAHPAPAPARVPDLGCEAGFTINGKFEFDVGSGAKKRRVIFTGPGVGPDSHGWTASDLAAILNAAIKQQYHERGSLTAQALGVGSAPSKNQATTPPKSRPGDTTHK